MLRITTYSPAWPGPTREPVPAKATPAAPAGPSGASAPFTLSQEALRLLASLKAPSAPDQPRPADRDPGQRVHDLREQLKLLLQRMHRAALLGDKVSAAALAKEAGVMAKDLAAAVHDAARAAKEPAAPAAQEEAAAPVPEPKAALPSGSGQIDPALAEEAGQALLALRKIVALAKATVARKTAARDAESAKVVAQTEKALAEASASIQADLLPAVLQKV